GPQRPDEPRDEASVDAGLPRVLRRHRFRLRRHGLLPPAARAAAPSCPASGLVIPRCASSTRSIATWASALASNDGPTHRIGSASAKFHHITGWRCESSSMIVPFLRVITPRRTRSCHAHSESMVVRPRDSTSGPYVVPLRILCTSSLRPPSL